MRQESRKSKVICEIPVFCEPLDFSSAIFSFA